MNWLARHRLWAFATICTFWAALIFTSSFFREARFLSAPWRGEQAFEDLLQRQGRKTPVQDDLIFVGIDQQSLQLDNIGPEEITGNRAFQLMTEKPFPWSRELWAILLDRLFRSGARLVIFDMVFSPPNDGDPIFRAALGPLVHEVKRLGLEGVVAKRSGSIYIPGRQSDAWQKHRFNLEAEFVIGGYVQSGRSFSSLVVGEYHGRELHYVKRVAAGFTPYLREQVFQILRPLVSAKCPFINLPETNRSGHGLTAAKMKECVWLKPERRCELEFVERTQSGRLRHAVFRQLVS